MIRFCTLAAAIVLSTCAMAQGWTSVAEMPDNHRTNHAFGFALEGVGYMVSGQIDGGFSDAFYAYDAGTDTWSSLDAFPGPARGYTIGDTWDGKAWMGFGDSNSGMLNDLWMFDPATGEWTEKASCPCSARLHPAFVAIDDHIYVGLGNSSAGNLNDWWEYDMATDSWEQMPNLPDVQRHHPYQFGVDGMVYTGLGHGDGIFNTWYRFDPSNETWTEMESLPGEGRVAGTQFSHGDMGYVLSGDGEDHSSMETGEFWQYDPANDAWTSWPVHPGMSRWAPSSFVIDNEVYLINGMSMDPGSFDYMDTNWKFALSPALTNDAGVASYEGDTEICGPDAVEVIARITNWGSENLSSAQINMVVDGTIELTNDWTGDLPAYGSADVSLGDFSFPGSTDFELTITAGDMNADNDMIEAAVTSAPLGTNVWRITLQTDNWGNETGWRIEDASGSVVAQEGAGTYGNLNTYVEEVALPGTGCFTFVLTDSFGDGLNGSSSNGSDGDCVVESLDADGNVDNTLAHNDGSFGFFSFNYLAEVVTILSVEEEMAAFAGLNLQVYPNPVNETLNLNWVNGTNSTQVVVEVVNAVGAVVSVQTVATTAFTTQNMVVDASAWESGMYMVRFITEAGAVTKAIVKTGI